MRAEQQRALALRVKKEKEYALSIAKTVRANRQVASPISSLSWQEFRKLAESIAREYDMNPAVIVGQAALESGHGTSKRARVDNNYFGHGACSGCRGMVFTSPEENIRYHARLISSGRYAYAYEARHDPVEMVKRIRAAGYATDVNYVAKVTNMDDFKAYQ